MSQFHIAKLDKSERLVFGWANVSVSKATSHGVGGEQFYDLQADSIPPDELEKAAYLHVEEYRETDEMHRGGPVGTLVESIVFTPEKLEKFCTDPVTGEVNRGDLEVLKRLFPTRWWVGYRLEPEAFAKVLSGEYRMFSIGGEAERIEVE